MKKKLLFMGLVLLLILAAGCAPEDNGEADPEEVVEEEEAAEEEAVVEEEEEEVYQFSLAHFFPDGHPAEEELVQGWAEELEQASGGRIEITSHPGGTLLAPADTYEGVVAGTADIGLSAFFYNRGRFPVLEVFELPGLVYENSYMASEVAWEGIKELEPEEVQDTELMFVLATGPGDLFTKEPVHNLEDLEGMKIRVAGLSAETLSLLGAAPEAMPQNEAEEALMRGRVDGNLAPVEVLKGWNHAEHTDYLTRTPFLYNALFFVTMNKEKWEELPSDLQDIFLEVNERFHEEVAAGLWDVQNEEALKWAVEETGQEVIELSEEEKERWIEKVQPIQDEFVQEMNEQGYDGEEILSTVVSLVEEFE
ncbi:MAG: TRAP transporter substrate-binding protein [Bacillota bacterium]